MTGMTGSPWDDRDNKNDQDDWLQGSYPVLIKKNSRTF